MESEVFFFFFFFLAFNTLHKCRVCERRLDLPTKRIASDIEIIDKQIMLHRIHHYSISFNHHVALGNVWTWGVFQKKGFYKFYKAQKSFF
jgi:hypothetical protein